MKPEDMTEEKWLPYKEIPGSNIHDYSRPGPVPEGPTWNTEELQRDFEVLGFKAPFVAVCRREDGVRGVLEFKHDPRVYFDFQPLP